jgi:hypothetical protein
MTSIFRMLLSEAIQNAMIVRNCPQLGAKIAFQNEHRKIMLHLVPPSQNTFPAAKYNQTALWYVGVPEIWIP